MKKTIGLIAICLAIATTAFPAFAQQPATTPQQPATTPQQPAAKPQQPAATPQQPAAKPDPQCAPENKLAWYNEFRQQFKTDTAKANELAKKWLACPEVAGEEQITPYLKNFVTLYEKANRKDRIHDLVYVKKDFPKAIELARAVLADEPDNLKVMIDLAYAGFAAAASKNESFNADAINYAKKAMQLIESGKKLDVWTPYADSNEALSYLNNIVGQLTLQKNPSEALPYLIKVAQYEGKLKKLPFTYATIAGAYEAGSYAKQSEEYKGKFGGKDETPESKLALENINQIVDRMIDAYARAVALAGNDAAQAAAKKEWMDSLSTWYKYRNKSDSGLNELIAGILAKPMPPVPTPITTLPAATPAAAGSNAGNSAGTAPATSPASANPAAANTTPAKSTTSPATTKPDSSAKPTPTPPKPRSKRNHRRG